MANLAPTGALTQRPSIRNPVSIGAKSSRDGKRALSRPQASHRPFSSICKEDEICCQGLFANGASLAIHDRLMPTTTASSKSNSLNAAGKPSALEQAKSAAAPAFTISVSAVTIFVSAFLLFQIELMMGKFLLPRFGGGPSVWSTSLLVFQVLLLAGYGYAALISSKLPARAQCVLHIALLASSGLVMAFLSRTVHSPIFFAGSAANTNHPVWQITFLLLTSVGIQSVLLSATSPLLQHWFACAQHGSPYRLYALSNLGSMLGLISYPLLVERQMTLSSQAWLWSAGYAFFSSLAAVSAFLFTRHTSEILTTRSPKSSKTRKAKKPSQAQSRFLWLLLPACSSTMLLATTNLICQQVAPVPLLWVLPLSLYLLSFVICFDHPRWYRREIFLPLYLLLTLLALRVLPVYSAISVTPLLAIYCSAMMAVCIVCHGELARMKPQTEHLTSFYLMISAGGALGSAAVVVLAPQIFDRFWEFQIALVGCAVLLAVVMIRDRDSWVRTVRFGGGILGLAVIILAVGAYSFTNDLLDFEGQGDIVLARNRNFFGVKSVLRERGQIVMVHGHTLHGLQRTDPAHLSEPTIYYSADSGVGLLLNQYRLLNRPVRIGVVGMGVGTLAAYGRKGDYFRFYEIDPAVTQFSLGSHPLFTFVQSSAADSDIVLGDARINLQQELSRGEAQNLDLLAVDAFNGDTVPIHLLTREAMDLYLRHLRGPGSVIAFHLSSTAIDLRPVVQSLASFYHLASLEVDTLSDLQPIWVLVSRDPTMLRSAELSAKGHAVEVRRPVPLWTDDYSSLYELLNW